MINVPVNLASPFSLVNFALTVNAGAWPEQDDLDVETNKQTKQSTPFVCAVQVAYRHVNSNTRQTAISYLHHITHQD